MSNEDRLTPNGETNSPTRVRHLVLTVATIMSVLLYLDRFAVAIAAEYIREDLRMTQTSMAWFISLFFWSYALFQVPAGWLSDRFGARTMLTAYIVGWSAFTGLMGIANAVWMMLGLRLLCGITQAGAYPTSASLIRQWYPISFRGTASSIVGLGGRFGAVLAPILTAWLIVFFVSGHPAPVLKNTDILDELEFMASFNTDSSADSQRALDRQRRQFVRGFLDSLSAEDRQTIANSALAATETKAKQRKAQAAKSATNTSTKETQATNHDNVEVDEQTLTSGIATLELHLFGRMSEVKLVDDACVPEKLSQTAKTLLARRHAGTDLTSDEAIRMNRFLLEALFPSTIRKSLGPGWRPTIIVYGIAGIIVALMFWAVTRNSPAQHPGCNEHEIQIIRGDAPQRAQSTAAQDPPFPCRAFLTSLSLWGNSMTQLLTNFGWFFVVSSLPRYLGEVHGVPLVTQGIMTAFPSGMGILALFFGGRCTDVAVRRFGLKWGRLIPLVSSRFTAAAGYGMCLCLNAWIAPSADKPWLPWLYIVGLCIAAMSTDFGTPAIWAYAQDVGGKYTGSILGWANMWGNLGAAIAPLIYNRCLGETPTLENWNAVFLVCCLAFVFAGLFAMLLDSTKILTIEAKAN